MHLEKAVLFWGAENGLGNRAFEFGGYVFMGRFWGREGAPLARARSTFSGNVWLTHGLLLEQRPLYG